jgi:hypothetical protein
MEVLKWLRSVSANLGSLRQPSLQTHLVFVMEHNFTAPLAPGSICLKHAIGDIVRDTKSIPSAEFLKEKGCFFHYFWNEIDKILRTLVAVRLSR